MHYSQNLTTILLEDINCGDEGAKILSEALKINQVRLYQFIIRSYQFRSSFHQALATVKLNGNSIEHHGATYLADALKINRVSYFGEMNWLCSSFYPSQTLQSLNLNYNSIKDEGVKHLAETLEVNQVRIS